MENNNSKMSNQYLIEKFNKDFPVGSKVMWRSISHTDVPYKEMTVRDRAMILPGGQPVAFFKERAGGCSIHPDFVKYELDKEVEEAIKVFLPENMPAEITRLTLENGRLEMDLGLAIIAANGFKSRLESANEYIERLESQRKSELLQHKEQMEQLAKNIREITYPELGNI